MHFNKKLALWGLIALSGTPMMTQPKSLTVPATELGIATSISALPVGIYWAARKCMAHKSMRPLERKVQYFLDHKFNLRVYLPNTQYPPHVQEDIKNKLRQMGHKIPDGLTFYEGHMDFAYFNNIYLRPEIARMDSPIARFIVSHELAHVKHKDSFGHIARLSFGALSYIAACGLIERYAVNRKYSSRFFVYLFGAGFFAQSGACRKVTMFMGTLSEQAADNYAMRFCSPADLDAAVSFFEKYDMYPTKWTTKHPQTIKEKIEFLLYCIKYRLSGVDPHPCNAERIIKLKAARNRMLACA